jgi:hypothetical protein
MYRLHNSIDVKKINLAESLPDVDMFVSTSGRITNGVIGSIRI